MSDLPLLIAFVTGTRLYRERDLEQHLPVLRNGPPGTFVCFPDGLRVSLPTDQIVCQEDGEAGATVGFGGMRYAGCEQGQLIFHRVREMHPEEALSPGRSHTMRLDPQWVRSVVVDGQEVWTAPGG
jgi:hypothetical protein